MPPILHIANKNYSSWSLRPWVLMTELGIPFEERLTVFGTPEENAAAFSGFSPSAKVPCLIDGSVTVWDSLAIAEYLAESHDGVWPESRPARAWARCASAEMHSGFQTMRETCSMNCGIRVRLHATSDALLRDLKRLDTLWQDGLRRFGGPFLAGNQFSAADAFFAPVAFRAQTYGLVFSNTAHDYLQRLLALPSMQAWYLEALREPYRDPAHERDFERYGSLTHDLRSQ